MLTVAVTSYFTGGVAIRYVFPVLWMTSRFHIMGFVVRHVYPKRRERNSRNYCIDSNQILLNDKSANIHREWCVGGEVCFLRLPCFVL